MFLPISRLYIQNSTVIMPSSLPLSHSAEFHPFYGNDGIVYYTRRLNLISYLHSFVAFNTIVQARNQLSPQGGSFSTNIILSKNFLFISMNEIPP